MGHGETVNQPPQPELFDWAANGALVSEAPMMQRSPEAMRITDQKAEAWLAGAAQGLADISAGAPESVRPRYEKEAKVLDRLQKSMDDSNSQDRFLMADMETALNNDPEFLQIDERAASWLRRAQLSTLTSVIESYQAPAEQDRQ